MTCYSLYLLMFTGQPCPLIRPRLSLSRRLIYVFFSYSYTCARSKRCQQTLMLLSSPLIYIIITGHSVPGPRHWRIYTVSLPGALCIAEETDASKHTDAVSSGRCSVKEQRVGRDDQGWQGVYFGQDGVADAQHFVGIPISISFNTSKASLVAPWNGLPKSDFPARDGDGRMLGLEAWQTRCVSHLQPLEELLEQMSMFPEVRLTLKCMLHGPLRSLVTLSASCPPGDCRVAYLYQIRAPSALTWPS